MHSARDAVRHEETKQGLTSTRSWALFCLLCNFQSPFQPTSNVRHVWASVCLKPANRTLSNLPKWEDSHPRRLVVTWQDSAERSHWIFCSDKVIIQEVTLFSGRVCHILSDPIPELANKLHQVTPLFACPRQK
ncbi:unnamed protein product [Protopolystoma xenopodis]|uniref:Uncharacterized protein n=1 Tax=Protopolystoma xenopodis TaxID=117903 RepID=A0A3S5C6X2_9PLAT|nr:unnamed protein product [Protopolystoma xenopodis]